jgi:ABC-type transport system involved in multi-copper enzyme maturation permease subunit
MTQTWAMIVDAYRELNARKLFWIAMALSVLCAGALGSLGINDKGITILWWEFPLRLFNTTFVNKASFYRWIFQNVGFFFWLSWAATIIAIISTASIFPDFVSSGAIELVLSKPISRVRLFLTRFLTGLLFVALQVSVFALLGFLFVGLRGGGWTWAFFWAVPLTILFFSYLFAISALVGLVTRSAITAIIVTALVWGAIVAAHTTELLLLNFKLQYELASQVHQTEQTARLDKMAELQAKLAEAPAAQEPTQTPSAKPDDPAAPWPTMDQINASRDGQRDAIEKLKLEYADREQKSKEVEDFRDKLRRYHAVALYVKNFLPKTAETMQLLERKLFSKEEQDSLRSAMQGNRAGHMVPVGGVRVSLRKIEADMEQVVRERPVSWVLGTSLGFEAIILGLACLIFSRRDF